MKERPLNPVTGKRMRSDDILEIIKEKEELKSELKRYKTAIAESDQHICDGCDKLVPTDVENFCYDCHYCIDNDCCKCKACTGCKWRGSNLCVHNVCVECCDKSVCQLCSVCMECNVPFAKETLSVHKYCKECIRYRDPRRGPITLK